MHHYSIYDRQRGSDLTFAEAEEVLAMLKEIPNMAGRAVTWLKDPFGLSSACQISCLAKDLLS